MLSFRQRLFSFFCLLLLSLFPFAAQAHLGSQNVFFEGPAGPFPVRVTIIPPNVVPGLAEIHVRVLSGEVQSVTALPVRSNIGTKGSPPPDVAKPVAGETNLFTAHLWLMDSGAYSVFVDVSGPPGRGTAIVPLNSIALQRLTMPRWMSFFFLGVGLFLLTLLVSVVGAAIREAGLPAGQEPTPGRRRLAMFGMAASVLIAAYLVFFGKGWWANVDGEFLRERLYRTQTVAATVTDSNGPPQLILGLPAPDRRRADSSQLIPDHGHLLHLFLIRSPDGDVFAHLHPSRAPNLGDKSFLTALPPLPAGDYQLYADYTHDSGFAETATNMLHITGRSADTNFVPTFADPDDALSLAPPQPLTPATLAGGFLLKPSFSPPFRAKQDITLRFDLTNPDGTPAPLEPYLGMYGHLIIQHADGGVFTHLHPLGSISMAAQKRFAEREHAGYLANQPLDLLCSPATPTLSFPYAFPRPGVYRLWLQTKLQAQIRTAAYTVTVTD